MRKQTLLAVLTLTLGMASADVTPVPSPSTGTSASVRVSADVQVLQDLIASGASITLLDKDGNAVASVNADGSLSVATGADLGKATTIQISVTATDGQTSTHSYTLASPLGQHGQLQVAAVNVKDKTQTLPLAAVLHRQAEAAHAANAARAKTKDSKTGDAQQSGEDSQDAEQSGDDGEQAGDDGKGASQPHTDQAKAKGKK